MNPRPVIKLVAGLLLAAVSAEAQEVVHLVRHAEKASGAPGPPRTPAGARRAEALARILKDADIRAIDSSGARPTRETARPLAEKRGVTPTVVDRGDPAGTFVGIRAEHPDDAVPVVGHTSTAGPLINHWDAGAVVEIAEDESDRIFVRVPEAPGRISPSRLRHDADQR